MPVIASWVANDGAWYAPPTTSADEEVLASFGLWLTGLSKTTKARLLQLYPISDFEHMVQPEWTGVSPQYYRAAQLNRDLWFTCPVLDFAWQYGKHNDRQVHLYEHNSTRFTPAYEMMGVPMWRVAHLSDIPYVLNAQRLGGGADNSAAQLELSKTVSRSIAGFVTSSNGPWPLAFADAAKGEFEEEFPSRLSLQVFGGPHGNDLVPLAKDGKVTATEAEKAVSWERLFERCEFINSAKMREETGV